MGDQNTNESRLLKLKEVLKNALELAQNKTLRQEDLKTIRKLWEQQESCLKEAALAGHPTVQEMLLDLQIIYSTGCYVGHHIRELQTSATQFSPSEYAEKLLAKFSENGEMDWWKMCNDAVRIVNRAPGIPVLLGTFSLTDAEVKNVREERQKPRATQRVLKGKEELAQKQTASRLENISEDKDSVDVKVKHILKVLRDCYKRNQNRPISFYRFVLHPVNFTITVENIFYISFIIRDGLARLDVTSDEELVISPLEKEGKIENPTNKNQMVFSITMEEWKMLVSEYNVKEPLIK